MEDKLIYLSQGKVTIVDDDDYEELNKHKWHCNSHGYAVRNVWINGKCIAIYMHRSLMKIPTGLHVDHIDGDPLNNQKRNLRSCTCQQNQFNSRSHKNTTSKYKGVCYYKQTNKWRAQANYCRNKINLGYFKTEEEAAKAYNDFALKNHGEYAKLNEVE